jgi:hypothetical protein
MKAGNLGWILSLAIVVGLLATTPALAQERIHVTYDTNGEILSVQFEVGGVMRAPTLVADINSAAAQERLRRIRRIVSLGELITVNPHCVHSRTCRVY